MYSWMSVCVCTYVCMCGVYLCVSVCVSVWMDARISLCISTFLGVQRDAITPACRCASFTYACIPEEPAETMNAGGGETTFPEIPLSIPTKRARAVLFRNTKVPGALDPASSSGSASITSGGPKMLTRIQFRFTVCMCVYRGVYESALPACCKWPVEIWVVY